MSGLISRVIYDTNIPYSNQNAIQYDAKLQQTQSAPVNMAMSDKLEYNSRNLNTHGYPRSAPVFGHGKVSQNASQHPIVGYSLTQYKAHEPRSQMAQGHDVVAPQIQFQEAMHNRAANYMQDGGGLRNKMKAASRGAQRSALALGLQQAGHHYGYWNKANALRHPVDQRGHGLSISALAELAHKDPLRFSRKGGPFRKKRRFGLLAAKAAAHHFA